MTFSFHPEAEKELSLAVDYYEECSKNLGKEFLDEIYQTIQRVINFPLAWQKLDDVVRRCLTKRFPFGVLYYVKEDEVVIIAVMQLNREPNYWKGRV